LVKKNPVGRPRKIKTEAQETPTQDGNDMLNEQIQQFASSLKQQINQMNNMNKSIPSVGQDYTQSVNISPREPTQKELMQWMKNPSRFGKQLRDASQYLENCIMQYQRSIKHMASIMTFKYDMRPLSKMPKDATAKATYMKSMDTCNGILQKLNIKYQFEKINWEIMEVGAKFVYIRQTDSFITLQDMPIDYCYITGKWDLGWTYAIDLTFFDKIANSQYMAPEFAEYYAVFCKMRQLGFNGSELVPYQYYPVPVEKGFVFTFDPIHAQAVPPLRGTFKDALEILNYKDLLKQKTTLDTWKLIASKIPYDTKSQKFIVDMNQATGIVGMLQQLMPSGVRTFATPFETQEVNFNQSQSTNNIVGLGENLYWKSVGISGNLYGDDNSSAMGILLSLEADFSFMSHLYRQYDNFVNWILMQNSRTYSWQVKFYGNKYTEVDDLKTYSALVSANNMPVGKLFGLAGFEPFEVMPVLELEAELGIKALMTPIIIGSVMSGKDTNAVGGAPKKDINNITPQGEAQINNDANAQRLK